MTNGGYEYRERLGPEALSKTLLAHLRERYSHSTEADWLGRICRGEVLLDGRPVPAEEALREGQTISWRRPPWIEEDVPRDYSVVLEDEHLLAVDKPSGLPTMPAGGFLENTLLTLVRRRDPAWTPMHRLGRGTSGLVLFARTPQARRALQEAWRGRSVRKSYRALASAGVPAERFDITVPIGPVRHPVLGRVYAAASSGKSAESHVTLLERRNGSSLVEVDIATGRPHQIRIHLAWAGHPLVGDPLYGAGGVPKSDALPGDLGYRLHAWRLGFAHPATGRPTRLEAHLPGWASAKEGSDRQAQSE